ncbi:gluconokinase [Falsirhodobacter deserti]|uniref:gluconokinase n=1 Tax=Falsirhodobacter deserti TaxID=1365611 RepID=UPI0019D46B9B|nr:gluconokinase, GntK/IdnK-type [Falsirhodobacter deserti]
MEHGYSRIVLMGVPGTGKTTIGRALSRATGLRYLDGDAMHTGRALQRMAEGVPLGDEDCWPWLVRVGNALSNPPLIAGCSTLKRSYRDLLRSIAGPIAFVHLTGAPAVIARRMHGRPSPSMPADLARQFADLQPPEPDEQSLTIDIDQPLEVIVANIQAAMGFAPASR